MSCPAILRPVTVGICVFSFAITAPAASTERQYLSGRDSEDAVPWRFFCTSGAQSGYWTNLPVPSNWEMHGFGTLKYRRDSTDARTERGLYELDFTVPPGWVDRRVFLVFDGVMTDTEVTLNGESAGPLHQGGFYRFKHEVTRLMKPGESNRLAVAVSKHSANASINRAERDGDYWLFGGIFRPVWIEAVPRQFIERVAVDARADGTIAIDVFVNGTNNAGSLEAQIMDLDGTPVGAPFSAGIAGGKTTLRTRIDSTRLWTAETPNLYGVEVTLARGNEALHRYTQRFGFRTIDVREGDGIYVNGCRVVLKGVNRHSFWPESGRCLNEAVHRMDIEAMKDMNMNAVRMSHYPPDEQFLDLCDELGLYVLDELAGWQKSYDTPTGRRLIEQLIQRDVNHPSILFWNNGNEGGWNTEVDDEFAKWDPQQRRVLHPWARFSGIDTDHYEHYDSTARLCATNVIFMSTEFLHGLYDGGIGAGFEDYWNLMKNSPTCAGGFFWVLADEGVKRPDTGEIDVAGNRAPDGIVGPYREREGSFYTVKELWSPIVVTRGANGAFTVENHYSFTDANQCRFTFEFRRFASPQDAAAGFTILEERTVSVPSIPPGTRADWTPSIESNSLHDAVALRVTDPTGRELWTWVWAKPADRFRELPRAPSTQTARGSEADGIFSVTAGDLVVRFRKESGVLLDVRRGSQAFSLSNGPRLAAGESLPAGVEMRQDGTDCVIAAAYSGDLKRVTWHVRGNGWVQCDYTYTANGPKSYHGVLFDYPEQLVKAKRWFGDGPFRVWKNRLRGVTPGVWENDYNNTITGWTEWKYPEFKGCFANVGWVQLDTSEGPITAILNRENIFVQVLKPELPPQNLLLRSAVSIPEAGLGFLHGIPPMGNKFSSAAQTGPQGRANQTSGEYSGSIAFHFGNLP